MKNQKWQEVSSDMDYRTYQKRIDLYKVSEFSINRLKAWVEKHSYNSWHCGHDWDCCGCHCSTSHELFIGDDTAIIERSEGFNY